MGLPLKNVAHRLRMTVALLQWCRRYSPKRDDRKLSFNSDGTIDDEEVTAFEEYLRAPWPDKNPGAEILREIARESRGLCGLCSRATDATEAAHIDRFGIELSHHCNHPHNLVMLCVDCHARYDRLKTIQNDTVKHAKQQLISRLMEDVDRDLEMSRLLQGWVAQHGPHFLSAWTASAQGLVQQAETVVTGSTSTTPPTSTTTSDKLSFLSGSVEQTSPLTAKLLSKYALSVKKKEPPPSDISIESLFDEKPPEPGRCLRDGANTPMESARCSACGEDAGHHSLIVDIGSGLYELYDEGFHGDTDQVACECGGTSFEVEFEALCEYCAHMAAKGD